VIILHDNPNPEWSQFSVVISNSIISKNKDCDGNSDTTNCEIGCVNIGSRESTWSNFELVSTYISHTGGNCPTEYIEIPYGGIQLSFSPE